MQQARQPCGHPTATHAVRTSLACGSLAGYRAAALWCGERKGSVVGCGAAQRAAPGGLVAEDLKPYISDEQTVVIDLSILA